MNHETIASKLFVILFIVLLTAFINPAKVQPKAKQYKTAQHNTTQEKAKQHNVAASNLNIDFEMQGESLHCVMNSDDFNHFVEWYKCSLLSQLQDLRQELEQKLAEGFGTNYVFESSVFDTRLESVRQKPSFTAFIRNNLANVTTSFYKTYKNKVDKNVKAGLSSEELLTKSSMIMTKSSMIKSSTKPISIKLSIKSLPVQSSSTKSSLTKSLLTKSSSARQSSTEPSHLDIYRSLVTNQTYKKLLEEPSVKLASFLQDMPKPVSLQITPEVVVFSEPQVLEGSRYVSSEPYGPAVRPVYNVRATGYNSLAAQTDSDPHITATGARTRVGIIAVSRDLLAADIPYGSLVKLKDLGNYHNGYGQGKHQAYLDAQDLFIVEDTLHRRKVNQIDVWFPTLSEANEWGVRQVELEVVRYGREGAYIPAVYEAKLPDGLLFQPRFSALKPKLDESEYGSLASR